MLLNKLLKAIQPVQVTGESDIEITGINIDSRRSRTTVHGYARYAS